MNTTTTLNALQSQMEAIISQFGLDACEAHAEAVYSQDFRSEPVRICDHLNSLGLSMEQFYEELEEVSEQAWDSIANEMYSKATGYKVPDQYNMSESDEYWWEGRDAWLDSYGLNQEDFINEATEIVFLCNYKGEGEGIAAFNSATAKLPIFKSKRESFMI